MSDVLPTVKIVNEKGETVIINLSDYDANVHKLATPEVLAPLKDLDIKPAEEPVQLESGLNVKKKRIKGVFMFVVTDQNGKDVSEAFESEELALDHIKVLEGR